MARFHATPEGNIPFTPEEEAARDAEEAAWLAEAPLRQAALVRQQRDELLAETDWRFRSDLTPSQAWIDYCQALRDIPQQPGFPNNVIWPNKPE